MIGRRRNLIMMLVLAAALVLLMCGGAVLAQHTSGGATRLEHELTEPPVDLLSWAALAALLTLTTLEIVLGIDNIVFIAIISSKLSPAERTRAQRLGIGAAIFMRILLLLGITWLMGLTAALLPSLPGALGKLSGKDLILAGGGLFLVAKSVWEIHDKLEPPPPEDESPGGGRRLGKMAASVMGVVVQIMLIDIIFSLDSVITAVGMSRQIYVMMAAIVIAGLVMMVAAKAVSIVVDRHPTIKILALSFLILIGVMLIAEAFDHPIPRGYIYFAMAFAIGVESINIRVRHVHAQPAAAEAGADSDDSDNIDGGETG